MKLLIDYFSVVLFYLAYQFYTRIPEDFVFSINAWIPLGLVAGEKSSAIYFAIFVGIVAAGLQTLIHWILEGKPTKLHLIAFFAFLLFGGITFFMRDPVFIKWKPTIVNMIFAIVFLGSTFVGKKSLVEHMLGNSMQVSKRIWNRLTLSWAIFFVFVAILNIIIAYNFSESTWVNFKLFGILGMTFCFLVIQALYLSKLIQVDNH